MCGITGFWDFGKDKTRDFLQHNIQDMLSAIVHRGPDDGGTWVDESLGLAFGHRRLSILDLSMAGKQPMWSRSKNLIIIYNGEVYNAPILRQELIKLGYTFNGTSDTEVILEAIDCFGLETAVKKFIGMFAFALWDNKDNKLFLVRDRLGVKPLYWGFINNVLFFGSQLKSFFQHKLWSAQINYDAVAIFLRINYIPGTVSIFKDIYKLEPGTIVAISQKREVHYSKFWQVPHIKPTEEYSLQDGQEQLLNLLRDSIKLRCLSDVPIGSFLSGGIDSSLVTAIMQEQSVTAINSFSIGFHNKDYNEAHHALQIAQHLRTNHEELYVTPQDAFNIIPSIPEFFDEPFADSSQIPTMLVSMMAAKKVKVVLSGDGGDELFAGYNHYIFMHKLRHIFCLPYGLRKLLGAAINLIPENAWNSMANVFAQNSIFRTICNKTPKFANKVLQAKDPVQLYMNIITQWSNIEELLQVQPINTLDFWQKPESITGIVETLQYLDLKNYLPEDILTKVDRASMAYSIETREPLLDHRIVEFSAMLPRKYKIHNLQGKWFLRQIAYKYIPKSLLDRPKMGFGVPIHSWLRGELREWAEDLLAVNKLQEFNLEPNVIRKRWQEHLNNTHDWQYSLWSVLMLQAWRQHWHI